jgi:hypothetical protein
MIDAGRIRNAARKPGLWGWLLAAASMAIMYAAGAAARRSGESLPGPDGADRESRPGRDRRDAPAFPVQPDGFSVRGVAVTGLALAIGVAAVAWILWSAMGRLAGARLMDGGRRQVLPQAEDSLWLVRYRGSGEGGFPLLQTDPSLDLRRFRAREDSLLNGWGWADRASRKVRVPIGLAMRLMAERGRLPDGARDGDGARDSLAADAGTGTGE